MAASIGDPFLLSTYALPKRPPAASSSSDASSKQSSVYATLQQSSQSSKEGYVSIAAQGDGVHLLDLSTLHPVVSHTLGPSCAFSCPAVTRVTHSDGVRTCATYAVMESYQGISAEERGRAVWMWKEDLPSDLVSVEVQKTKVTAMIPHRVSSVHAPDELPHCVLLIGPGGDITVTESNLTVKSSFAHETQGRLIQSFVFPCRSSTFSPSWTASAQGVVIMSILEQGATVHAHMHSVSTEGQIAALADCTIPVDSSSIVDVSCSASGIISVLTRSGLWHTYQFDTVNNSLSLSTHVDPIHLKSLSFAIPSNSPDSPSSPLLDEASVLSLGSSHVLLSGVTSGPGAELVLLLWDLQYSVLLASHTCPIPTSLARTKKQGVKMRLVGSATNLSQALLLLSPNMAAGAPGQSADASPKSSVLVVPLTVPPVSTIANAMGQASLGARWLVQETQKAIHTDSVSQGLDSGRVKVLKAMRSATEQKRVEAVDDAFFNWVSQEEKRLAGQSRHNPTADTEPVLGHQFVKHILDIVFRQPKGSSTNADTPYSPKVVRYLMGRGVVSASMVEGGLFPALRLRRDWQSMLSAFKTVIDIPETDIVSFLREVIVAERIRTPNDDTMQVDTSTDDEMPSVADVIRLCAIYPTSAAAMRLAFRQHLPEIEDLVRVLELLAKWLDVRCAEAPPLLPVDVKDSRGVLVPVFAQDQKDDLPPLDKILALLQILLDSSFLAFISHPPAHQLLRQLFSRLQPELGFIDEVAPLRGPLEPFAKAHSKALLESIHGVQKPDLKVDWRRRKKAAHEQSNIAIGVYQVEELVL